MKRHLTRRAAGLLLALLLVSSFASASQHTNTTQTVQPRYTVIRSFLVNLQISESGYAQGYSNVLILNSGYTIEFDMELQRSSDGRSWNYVKSWTGSGPSIDKGWFVSSGYSYRVYTTASVYDASGNLVETASSPSQIVDYY